MLESVVSARGKVLRTNFSATSRVTRATDIVAGSDLCFRVSGRDRIAPDCAHRHPVLQIVALQRRMRFSARLAGFCRGRCRQRRARRAELASFSVFVSNLDFRVPRLRQRGSGPLTGPCGGGKEAAREAQNRGRATADGEPISEMADAGIVLLRPFLRRVDLFARLIQKIGLVR